MMASGDTTISAGYAKALLDLAVSKGARRAELLDRCGIDPELLHDQDNRVPLTDYMALMQAGVDLCRDPALPLLFGEEVTTPQLTIVALIAQAAETMEEALAQINRYARLMIDGDDIGPADLLAIRREGNEVWLELTSKVYVEHPQITESAFARMVSSSRQRYPDRPFVKSVHFTHSEPGYRAEFDRIFRVPVVFDSNRNALQVEESILSQKMAEPNRYVFGILSERADALMCELDASKTMKGSVERLMMPLLHTGDLSMDVIAEKLGISRQTLYRRLKEEGVSFDGVLDALRREMAEHYLSGRKVSVKEAAYLTGFSDTSAFSRAHKRWTGRRPSAGARRPVK